MTFLFEMMQSNLAFLSAAQERNEAAARAVLDFSIAASQQNVDTAMKVLDLVAGQGKVMAEAAKANEKVMEEAIKEGRDAVVKTAEQIVRGSQPN